MKKLLLISGAWFALTASIASAGGVRLAWNDCLGAGGASNRTFACDTNVGSNDLYASFDPPVDLPDVNGANVIIDLFDVNYISMPAWWQFKNIGSCRIASLSAGVGPGGCASPWSSQAIPSIAAYYTTAVIPSASLYWARILAVVSVPSVDAAAVQPGTEYTVLVIRINNLKTVGLGACSGCQQQICLVLSEVLLTTINSGDSFIKNPM